MPPNLQPSFLAVVFMLQQHCMCEGWKKAQKSVTLSQKKPRDKFWPEMNLRRRELRSKKEKKEREGTSPLIPTFTILLFQAGKNARERKAISNKNLTTSTTKGILLHLLESLSPISLWKATALGFIFIVQKKLRFHLCSMQCMDTLVTLDTQLGLEWSSIHKRRCECADGRDIACFYEMWWEDVDHFFFYYGKLIIFWILYYNCMELIVWQN